MIASDHEWTWWCIILGAQIAALVLLLSYYVTHPESRSATMTPEELADWADDVLFPPLSDLYDQGEED